MMALTVVSAEMMNTSSVSRVVFSYRALIASSAEGDSSVNTTANLAIAAPPGRSAPVYPAGGAARRLPPHPA